MKAEQEEGFSDSKTRHEIKFVLPLMKHFPLAQWLRSRCRPDSRYPAGAVSSIYYDTRGWRHLEEKVNSDFVKTKVRLRWYSGLEDGVAGPDSFLEIKKKQGSRREKVRLKTAFSGPWLSRVALQDQRLREISRYLAALGEVLLGPLTPAFLLQYKRLRFVEPVGGARLSLDYDISAPRVNPALSPRSNPLPLDVAVLEIKGSRTQLPDTLHEISYFGCRKESFSKYRSCYEKITGAVQ